MKYVTAIHLRLDVRLAGPSAHPGTALGCSRAGHKGPDYREEEVVEGLHVSSAGGKENISLAHAVRVSLVSPARALT